MPPLRSHFDRSWPLLALGLVWIALLVAILALNGGIFTYTLDDAYIHLAFSEELAQGHFGLVSGEPASPSSSILYPLLLMPLAGTALHQFQPLAWNLAALLVSFLLWRHLLGRLVLDGAHAALAAVMALLVLTLLNQIGLAFSGMEAGLQIDCSLAVAIGLVELAAGNRLRWWLPAAIVLGPLLRYESLTVSLPALALLALWGRWRWAALGGAVIAAALVGYGFYCRSIGLPAVPGSLLAKTGFDQAGDWASELWNLAKYLGYGLVRGRADLPVLLLVGLLLFDLTRRRAARERGLIVLALIALLTQFALGGHGSLGRYDVHAWACGLAVAAYIHRGIALQLTGRIGASWVAIGWAALLVGLFPYAVHAALGTPLAANNIYLQQYQMRRLLVDFARGRAIVNDAGLSAYRNPYGIVDIVGLGSERIRRLRRDGPWTAETVQAQGKDAALAAVYAGWLPVPPSWQAVAVLRLERRRVSVAGSDVTIYALRPADLPGIRAALQRFAPTLPPGARLVWSPSP